MTKKKNISQEDINIWQKYIKNPNDITDKDQPHKNKKLNIYRFKYDLHGYTLVEANIKVRELILFCTERNYKEILLVTGKGIHSNTDNDIYVSKDLSKLRYSIPEYLNSENELSKNILSINVASESDGGEGALIIKLRKL